MEEMQQLLSMGFPEDMAAQALAATGGKSTVKATEWILTHKPDSNPNPNPNPNLSPPPPPPNQPKINHFFNFQSKRPPKPQFKHQPEQQEDTVVFENEESEQGNQQQSTHRKRPKTQQLGYISSSENIYKPPPPQPQQPLSERMRPKSINDVVGQDHILSTSSLLRSAVDCDRLPSVILWGPPGSGKTSIARSIVTSSPSSYSASSYKLVSLSAVTCGVRDIRDAVDDARKLKAKNNKRTVLFLDEVHRFNKSQQDSFLPVIEDGSVVFIGATTENPSFHLITPLLSRCRVLKLHPLKPHHVLTLLNRALSDSDNGLARSLGFARIEVESEAVEFLSENCDGDARVALNALEISATTASARLGNDQNGGNGVVGGERNGSGSLVAKVTLDDAKEALQCKHLAYDKAGEEHYNLISALHKSMRGNDANAGVYWLARMLEGGEEPLYIARRLVRFASEDVGLADPSALTQAVACYQACHFLGMPECNVNLAQCVAYLALAPKSVAVYKALEAARKVVRESVGQNEGVPLHLRNAPTKLMKEFEYGKGYIYTPDDPSSSATQTYLPVSLQGYKFLNWPDGNGTDQ